MVRNIGSWYLKYHSDDVMEYLDKLLFAPDALLLGRQTYEFFAEVWPARQGHQAERINSMPKYVVSRTLQNPLKWNATLIEGDIAEEIGKLKQKPGKDLVKYGVGELTNTILRYGLVDELRLLVFPFIFGKGPRIFENFDLTTLKPIHTHTFKSGVIALHYVPQSNG